MHELSTIVTWVEQHKKTIAALALGGTGISVGLEAFLQKFQVKSKRLAYTFMHFVSLGSALVAHYTSLKGVLPSYAALAMVSQTVHRFAVDPFVVKYVEPFLNFVKKEAATAPAQSPTPTTPDSFEA